jgi:hypothetical protein
MTVSIWADFGDNTHRSAWIGVGSGFLNVSQWDPGIKRGGDERMPQCVRPDGLGDPGPAGDAADDPPGAVPIQPAAVSGQEHRPVCALADGQVDRPGGARRERDRYHLAALRVTTSVRCPRPLPERDNRLRGAAPLSANVAVGDRAVARFATGPGRGDLQASDQLRVRTLAPCDARPLIPG